MMIIYWINQQTNIKEEKNTFSIVNLEKENKLSIIINVYYVGCTVQMQSRPYFNISHINFFFREFQLIVSTLNDSFLSLDQDTN